MEARSLKYVAEACGGELRHGAATALVGRICTDSRQLQAGDLFVALSGEKFDAHTFVPDVIARGAGAVLVEAGKVPAKPGKCGVIAVADTRKAYGQLAARYRKDFNATVIAVGGSNGKTTTKELIAALLRERCRTLASEASFNNDVGVPTTLLRLESAHQAAVLEVGTNHPGELAPLIRMVQPQFGVITSIGREHLEFFGDVAGVAQEEGKLAELLPADGKLFVNADSPEMDRITRRTRATVVRVGLGEGCDWRATRVKLEATGTTFNVKAPESIFSGQYRLGLLGRHQVTNGLLALAVAAELGLGREEGRRALAGCTPPKMRLQSRDCGGVRLLDDSYNANADSMRAALQTLHDLPCTGRRVAVLGDMAELGKAAEGAHVEVGKFAAESGVNRLLAVGRFAHLLTGAAKQAGLSGVSEHTTAEEAAVALKEFVKPGDVVLVKASRSARLERVSEVLQGGK